MAILSQRIIVGTLVNVYAPRKVGRNDQSVVNLKIAVTQRIKDESAEGGWRDGDTEWISGVCWGKLADNVAESLKVGDQVIGVGRTTMKAAWTNSETGEEKPAEAQVTFDFLGLELGRVGASSDREAKKNTVAQDEAAGVSSAPAKKSKPTAKKSEKAAPKKNESIFDDDDDEDLFSDDDDDDFSF